MNDELTKILREEQIVRWGLPPNRVHNLPFKPYNELQDSVVQMASSSGVEEVSSPDVRAWLPKRHELGVSETNHVTIETFSDDYQNDERVFAFELHYRKGDSGEEWIRFDPPGHLSYWNKLCLQPARGNLTSLAKGMSVSAADANLKLSQLEVPLPAALVACMDSGCIIRVGAFPIGVEGNRRVLPTGKHRQHLQINLKTRP